MKNNDLFQASRRRFLLQLGGLTVAGMLGPSLLTPRSANAAEVQGTGVKEDPDRISLGGNPRHRG